MNVSLPSFHFISTTNGVYQNKCVFWLPLFAKSCFYIERDCCKEGKLWREASILWCPSQMNYIIGTLRNNSKNKGKNDSATISNAQLFWFVTWNHCKALCNDFFSFQRSNSNITSYFLIEYCRNFWIKHLNKAQCFFWYFRHILSEYFKCFENLNYTTRVTCCAFKI